MSISIFKSVRVFSFGKTLAQHGVRADVAVSLFVQVSNKHVTAGTASFSGADADGEGSLRRTPHSHQLPGTEDSDQFAICPLKVFAKF